MTELTQMTQIAAIDNPEEAVDTIHRRLNMPGV